VDAFPVWGDVFRLRPSDRGPGAVPFLIAMCHEPPHARNGSSQLRSTSYQSAQALHSAPGRGGGQHPLRMLLSFCDVRADRKFARGPWNRHPLGYGTRGCKGTRPSGGIDERQENRDCCHGCALIFSLERLIAQRSMVFEVGATPVAMCHCCAACFVRIGATPRICERR
jgi:hypothetical protein